MDAVSVIAPIRGGHESSLESEAALKWLKFELKSRDGTLEWIGLPELPLTPLLIALSTIIGLKGDGQSSARPRLLAPTK